MNSASAAGFMNLCAGIIALEIYCFGLDPQSGAGAMPASEAPLLDSALELLLPLGAAGMLCAAAAYIYRHLSHAAVPAANKRRPLRVVVFVLCVCTGVLDYLLFVHPAGAADYAAQARALGLAAHRALPAAAAATFFWGVMLFIIGHVRSGGEGGGGAGAGHGANEGTVRRVVNNIALGAAAGFVFLVTITMAFCVE